LAKTKIGTVVVDQNVNIEGAWKHSKGKGVVIAVIDDGIDIDHPEFAGRIAHPFDATLNNADPRPKTDDESHGTACAGVACAAGLKDGASGTAPESTLMPIRLRSGLGSMAEANAFVWAADKGADVISCSWGPTDGEWWNPSDPVHNRRTALPDSTRLAIDYAATKGRKGKGCVILFAAGNGNEDTVNDGYASYRRVIAVAACNDRGSRSVYSDYGKAVWVCFPSGDYAWQPFRHPAPISTGLRTTDRRHDAGYDPGDYVNSFGGTSGACPGAAGVAALILAANPKLSAAQVKNLLKTSATPIDKANGDYDAKGHSIWYGYGRVDAGKAVEGALKRKK
jgi:subtilisin family serine protease